jgi:hypothetical protein
MMEWHYGIKMCEDIYMKTLTKCLVLQTTEQSDGCLELERLL